MLPEGYEGLSFDSLDSTNEEAKRRGEHFDGVPTWIIARDQLAGRGRRGRAWISNAGNLFASLLTERPDDLEEASQLGFIAALAVHDLVKSVVPDECEVRLKWPNDVLIGGKKVSGILLESASGTKGHAWIVIGIGINLVSAPDHTPTPATWLGAHGTPAPEPLKALGTLAMAFDDWLRKWRGQGFAPIRESWLEHGPSKGSRLIVRAGAEEIEGRFQGLDGKGALLILLPGGEERRILAGDVYVLE